jgi:hypothetical protein
MKSLIQADRVVEKVQIQYATKASKVNVHKLKVKLIYTYLLMK